MKRSGPSASSISLWIKNWLKNYRKSKGRICRIKHRRTRWHTMCSGSAASFPARITFDSSKLESAQKTNLEKVALIEALQQKAKEDIYSKAWSQELKDYKERNNSTKGLVATLRKIKQFKLVEQGKEQSIDADYRAMFGSSKLIGAHQNLLEDAYKEIIAKKELVFGIDWQKLTTLPESKFV